MPINSSNLPTTYTFKFEDYPGAPQWFSQFLQQLNLFAVPVFQILNGNISYQNVTFPRVFTKTITTPASGNVTFNFTNPLRISPSAVLLGNVYQGSSTSTHPSSPVTVLWHESQGTIYIDNVTNLSTSTMYNLSLVVF